ncbi:hypothetical protein [Legionella erythra]|uniref:Polysaccharide deacetylase n=1 Tax=Legionella erythra TaxID=448 RepID=A0A0W0TJD9_LEGER|nr:hypothetical protein [Legionella erythra]KTC95688.1 hypothetical protein Lery_1983 [Legionella erythra]
MNVDLNSDKGLQYHIDDFTINEYKNLLRLAKSNYKFITYNQLDSAENYVLWRHDCDFSLNRALRVAQIEQEESITATYFINPHCEFYNLLEKSQSNIIRQIIQMGHQIGLHFDADYYDVTSEDQLDELIVHEKKWLEDWFDVGIEVFSFHNPLKAILHCEKASYGGLINCYSSFFKNEISYCSDSNGYWRFRRLKNILEEASDSRLHVLTHPGWWQETPMLPRARVLRAVEGRAAAVMAAYDALLAENGRKNIG